MIKHKSFNKTLKTKIKDPETGEEKEFTLVGSIEADAVYMSIRNMELSLVVTGVGGGIKHTNKLQVRNFKKAMHSPDASEWRNKINKEKG